MAGRRKFDICPFLFVMHVLQWNTQHLYVVMPNLLLFALFNRSMCARYCENIVLLLIIARWFA